MTLSKGPENCRTVGLEDRFLGFWVHGIFVTKKLLLGEVKGRKGYCFALFTELALYGFQKAIKNKKQKTEQASSHAALISGCF